MQVEFPKKLPLGVSSCLLGEKVRYDGGHKRNAFILEKLPDFFELTHFCPEMNIGLGVPREPIRLIALGSHSDTQPVEFRIVNARDPEKDHTDALIRSADEQQAWLAGLSGYIFKKDSPSCGIERVKYYRGDHAMRSGGVGIFAARVKSNNPLLPLEDEGRLNDVRIRENFVQRVYVYARWQNLVAEGLTPKKLIDFHRRHKFLALSRNQKAYRELGRFVADLSANTFAVLAQQYIEKLMGILKKIANRKNHVNVLQHIQGYLGEHVPSSDRQEIAKIIDGYRNEELPLIVPLTLLKDYFRKHPNDYIGESYYLSPYPEKLALSNQL